MRKWMMVIWAMVMVLSLSSSVFADGNFTSSTVNLGKDANGKRQVQISWNPPPGKEVSHYEVKRHDVFYAWFWWDICNNTTQTTCIDNKISQKGTYDYFVIAHLTDGTKIEAPVSRIPVADYLGVPAVPTITVSSLGNRNYKVGFSITSGNNADFWYLYQNGSCTSTCYPFQDILNENGNNPQSASLTLTLQPGTYVYTLKLVNTYGVTWAVPYTLVVP
ncbi:hypothetical protein MH117_17925 [Paenibacillus sp. ACRRX]|uniref:hypothetical protein n=1 Tax=unclassified Paenibacillus TaxID=185978 RepID=UPI001EF58EBB|nr:MULTISPECIES: hypothetical protein [unclassified Paenibacillus]MCG7409299.1 hypothetical protein [Paenibacillus sp. ACRRX]MDK8179951.1 hypothetical protein [Paenibacillus sp. UMB4589-SE434]